MSDIIVVNNLVKKYGDLIAVNDISFTVSAGEIFGFLGPNGAGKSTTIKMLTTLLDPTSGTILVNGHDPAHHKDLVRKSFGIVFQDPSLDDDLTAMENMRYHAVMYKVAKSLADSRIEELLRFVELWDRRKDFVKTFSGGMKRRLEVARGLIHHPHILFLDEPTLGLDPQTRNHIWGYLQEINQKEQMTVFFTTHYMEEAAKVASRIAIIDHGRIVASGSTADLQSQTGTNTLEEAFIALTGKAIRDEAVGAVEQMRVMHRRWGRH